VKRVGRSPRALLLGALAIAALWPAAAAAQPTANLDAIADLAPACPSERTCIGIHLHVVVTDGEAVQSATWVATQLEEANRHFEPVGVGFELAAVDALPDSFADIDTRDDRDRLGATRYSRGVVHVFVVRRLSNVDEEGVIRGVHWRWRKKTSARWVILSSIAPSTVLAHELGHFFGLPHSTWDVSIMNKTPRAEPPAAERTFHSAEVRVMKVRKRAMISAAELTARKAGPVRSRPAAGTAPP